jgi:predicted acylesterase/phospholipase RssA
VSVRLNNNCHVQAVLEAGIPIDRIGGVSIGAFMGALWCQERDIGQVLGPLFLFFRKYKCFFLFRQHFTFLKKLFDRSGVWKNRKIEPKQKFALKPVFYYFLIISF